MKTKIVYWSGTGNTEMIADEICKSAKNAGAEVEVLNVSDADVNEIKEFDVIALGCPAMGDEVLEEEEFEPFFGALEPHLKGKKVAIFGSYSWNEGKWMRDWEERVKAAGAELLTGAGLDIYEAPDCDDDFKKCAQMGEAIAKA